MLPDGSTTPFPNEAWASAAGDDGVGLVGVPGLRADANGIVWMLDGANGLDYAGRLVAWDTRQDKLHRIIYLSPPVAHAGTFSTTWPSDVHPQVRRAGAGECRAVVNDRPAPAALL